MSEGLNRVTLIGNLGQDPELRQAGEGWVLSLRLATSESYLDSKRVRQERTEWHRVSVWGKRGEALARLLSKGSKLCVEGSLRTRSYDGNDGTKRYSTEIVARNIVLLGGGTRRPSSADEAAAPPADNEWDYPAGDDDIPF